MAATILLSKPCISAPHIDIFCLFAEGPLADGVGGTADKGVGGCGIVADAGVRGTVAPCDFLLPGLDSGVLA